MKICHLPRQQYVLLLLPAFKSKEYEHILLLPEHRPQKMLHLIRSPRMFSVNSLDVTYKARIRPNNVSL